MAHYSRYQLNSKLRKFLGNVEGKMEQATATGSEPTASTELSRMMPHTTTGRYSGNSRAETTHDRTKMVCNSGLLLTLKLYTVVPVLKDTL